MTDLSFTPALDDAEPYDEFALVAENAAEMGVAWPLYAHAAARLLSRSGSGQLLSAIRWGDAEPELVFLHGGGQNAHTWDSVIVALGRPTLAIDLPGPRPVRSAQRPQLRAVGERGRGRRGDRAARAGTRPAVIGMSLGGATNIRLPATRPDLVRHAVIVDVTPSVNDEGRVMTPEQRGTVALVSGPPTYDSFEAVFEVTMAASPLRTEAGVRRGLRHNMVRLDDGRWRWRYDLGGSAEPSEASRAWIDFTSLWDDVAAITVPTMLVLGGESVFVLPEDARRVPPPAPGGPRRIGGQVPATPSRVINRRRWSPSSTIS